MIENVVCHQIDTLRIRRGYNLWKLRNPLDLVGKKWHQVLVLNREFADPSCVVAPRSDKTNINQPPHWWVCIKIVAYPPPKKKERKKTLRKMNIKQRHQKEEQEGRSNRYNTISLFMLTHNLRVTFLFWRIYNKKLTNKTDWKFDKSINILSEWCPVFVLGFRVLPFSERHSFA